MEVLASQFAAAEVADGVRWLLIAVFALAAVEKGTSVWTRSAAWHPVMLVSAARRRHATPLMTAALAADVGTIGLLATAPAAGGPAAALLTVSYAAVALPMYSGRTGGCACFWKLLETRTRASFLSRNAVLASAAVAVAASPPSSSTAAGIAFGATLVIVLAAAVALLDAVLRSPAAGSSPRSSERADSAARLMTPRSGVRSTAAERR